MAYEALWRYWGNAAMSIFGPYPSERPSESETRGSSPREAFRGRGRQLPRHRSVTGPGSASEPER